MIVDYFKAPVNGSWEKQVVLNRLEFIVQGPEFLLGSCKVSMK